MSDYDELEDVTDEADDAQDAKNWRKALAEKARAEGRREAEAERDKAQRELALLKAGIDLDSPQGKLFAKAYDGANTVDAIKAAATEYGVLEPPTPQVPPEELAALERVSQASAGAQTSNEEQDAFAELDKAGDFYNGGSAEAVLEVLRKHGIGIDTTKPGTRWLQGGGQATPATNPLS